MDTRKLNDNIEVFIKDKINYIQNYLNTNVYSNDDFFSNAFISYGKDYIDGISFKDGWGKNGIYIIFMDTDVYLDYNAVYNFNECATGGKICLNHYEAIYLKNGDCIYLGSATKESLYSRLNQHFRKSTCYSSLHLNEENRIILKDKIKIFAFPVKNKKIKHIATLLKVIEKELHEIYRPKAGGNRT